MIKLVQDKLQALKALCEKREVSHLELFGSAVRGGFQPGKSDLDFVVEFSPRVKRLADSYLGLADDLEALFECRVDLLERAAVTNPYLIRSIEDAQETVYARP